MGYEITERAPIEQAYIKLMNNLGAQFNKPKVNLATIGNNVMTIGMLLLGASAFIFPTQLTLSHEVHGPVAVGMFALMFMSFTNYLATADAFIPTNKNTLVQDIMKANGTITLSFEEGSLGFNTSLHNGEVIVSDVTDLEETHKFEGLTKGYRITKIEPNNQASLEWQASRKNCGLEFQKTLHDLGKSSSKGRVDITFSTELGFDESEAQQIANIMVATGHQVKKLLEPVSHYIMRWFWIIFGEMLSPGYNKFSQGECLEWAGEGKMNYAECETFKFKLKEDGTYESYAKLHYDMVGYVFKSIFGIAELVTLNDFIHLVKTKDQMLDVFGNAILQIHTIAQKKMQQRYGRDVQLTLQENEEGEKIPNKHLAYDYEYVSHLGVKSKVSEKNVGKYRQLGATCRVILLLK